MSSSFHFTFTSENDVRDNNPGYIYAFDTMTSVLWSYARFPVYAASGLAFLFSSALYYYQREIIYPRNLPAGARTEILSPKQFQITDYEELQIPTPDGETLHAFLVKPPNMQYFSNITILQFHGNAGANYHRLPIAKKISFDMGCNVLLLEYRGYGLSTGDPSEKGLTIDAQTGLDFIRSRDDLKKTKIVIYGQSIGGAVGIGLTAANLQGDIAGLILENTFLSIAKMIPSVMPAARILIPFCHEKWPSEKYIVKIKETPILFLSGLKDEIVPPNHMKTLYDICTSNTKIWRELPDGDHNNTVASPAYFRYFEEFLKIYVMSQ